LFKLVVAGIGELNMSPLTHIVQFADDTCLVAPTQDNAQLATFQQDVDRVIAYFAQLGLKTNPKKSQHLLVSVNPRGPTDTNAIIVNGNPLEKIEQLKYLGVLFDTQMSFRKHVEVITKRARSMLYQLRGLLQRSNCRLAMHHIYSTVIRPIMMYACAAYYPSDKGLQQRLARVDRTAAHMICNKYKQGTGDALVRQLNWHFIGKHAEAERIALIWQYVNGDKRTPAGSTTITEIAAPPRTSACLAQHRSARTQYQVNGMAKYSSSSRFNSPLAHAVQLNNKAPYQVFWLTTSARALKSHYLSDRVPPNYVQLPQE
jgi:hypothetical protein